jgi:hypothetical protein
MSNSNEFIRKLADINPTPEDKGLMVSIEVKLFDEGGCQVNGHYFKSPTRTTSVARQVLQIIEALEQDRHKRQNTKGSS